MSLSTLLNRPCTIVQRSDSGNIDDYGDPVQTEVLVETTGELQQFERQEPIGQGEFSVAHWTLFLPAGTQIDTSDAVIVGGEEYGVEGEPWLVRNPRTGSDSHLEVTLVRAAGAGDVG